MVLPIPTPQLASEDRDVFDSLSGEWYPFQQNPLVPLMPSQAVTVHCASSPYCLAPGWYTLPVFIVDKTIVECYSAPPPTWSWGYLRLHFTHCAPQSRFLHSESLTQSLNSCRVPSTGTGDIEVNKTDRKRPDLIGNIGIEDRK